MILTNALIPLKEDERDLTLAGVFDQIDIKDVPMEDFSVAEPLVIKNQGDTDYCSAYAITEVSEDQEGFELLPEYQFFKTKLLSGNPESWGADLRTACKVPVTFGSLPLKGNERYKAMSRTQILSQESWPQSLDDIAKQYRKETFLKITGRYDLFDNIRTALWQHRDDRRSIVVGAKFKEEWIHAEGGVIPKEEFDGGFGHAFKIDGQKIINGEVYLKAVLSNGEEIGDKGKFYFPRSVVNRELAPYGQFMFKDITREDAEYYMTAPYSSNTPFLKKLLLTIISIITKYVHA